MMLPSTIITDDLTAYGYRSAQSESTILTDLNGNDVIGSVGMLENIIKNLSDQICVFLKQFYGSYFY